MPASCDLLDPGIVWGRRCPNHSWRKPLPATDTAYTCPLFPRKQTQVGHRATSELGQNRKVRNKGISPLVDHLIRNRDEARRKDQPKDLGSSYIDHEFEFSRLQDRKSAGMAENARTEAAATRAAASAAAAKGDSSFRSYFATTWSLSVQDRCQAAMLVTCVPSPTGMPL